MKKLILTVTDVLLKRNASAEKEKLIIAYACSEPQNETERVIKEMAGVLIKDTSLVNDNKFANSLYTLVRFVNYASSDAFLTIDPKDYTNVIFNNGTTKFFELVDIIKDLRNISAFKNDEFSIDMDKILIECIDSKNIHKIKSILTQVENLCENKELTLMI